MLKRSLLFCRSQSEETRYKVVRELLELLQDKVDGNTTGIEVSYERNRIIESITCDPDPMEDLKRASLDAARVLAPRLEEYVESSGDAGDRFRRSLRVALAGNTIEFGPMEHGVDLEGLGDQVMKLLSEDLAIDQVDEVYDRVQRADSLLYLTDNTAEIVFDKLFIRELCKYCSVTAAPLSKPVQDDATMDDARGIELDKLCTLLPRGDCIGVWPAKCTPEFMKKLIEADVIIAKGMANYETLTDYPELTGGRVALLFKAKCTPVARDAGIPLGTLAVKII